MLGVEATTIVSHTRAFVGGAAREAYKVSISPPHTGLFTHGAGEVVRFFRIFAVLSPATTPTTHTTSPPAQAIFYELIYKMNKKAKAKREGEIYLCRSVVHMGDYVRPQLEERGTP
jgi:hypothetical protein